MRISEIIKESVNDPLSDKIAGLLMALKAEGVEKVNTKQIMRSLKDSGILISEDHLIGILENMPAVSAASKHSIYLGDLSSSYRNLDVDGDETSDVSKTAQDRAKKEVEKN